MRVIHQVRLHEKFVASGTYTHYAGNIPTGAVEHWSIHQLPDQSEIIRVDTDRRKEKDLFDTLAITTLLQVYRRPLNDQMKIERIDIRVQRNNQHAKQTWLFHNSHVEVTSQHNDEPSEHNEYLMKEGYVVIFVLSMLLYGFAIAQSALNNGKCTSTLRVYVTIPPHALQDDDAVSFMDASIDDEQAQAMGARWFTFGELCDFMPAYNRARYEKPKTYFGLNEHNILLHVFSKENDYTIKLSQYAHRPEPK